MHVAVHLNPSLSHQQEHGEWFRQGFRRHGIRPTITSDINLDADIHIISGPWYAKKRWLGHDNVLLLDRCYYKGDPEHVSLGWMRPDGGRYFKTGTGRELPRVEAVGTGKGSIFLADYAGPIEQADAIRLHPSQHRYEESLHDVLRRYAIAIGYQTTALVTAGLMGLDVICKDNRNIMSENNWLELLPYADWHNSEIRSGEAWEHLCQQL